MASFLIQHTDLTEDYETRLRKVLGYSSMTSSDKKEIKMKPLFTEDGYIRIGSSNVDLDEMVLRDSIEKEIRNFIDEHRNRSFLKEYNLPISNKILFFGPSGCGKTFLATALAKSLKKSLFIVNLAKIVESGLGQTSNNISRALEDASGVGAIIFFDEFDALGKKRADSNDHGEMKRVTSSLLQLIDHLDDDSILIAATNHTDLLDHAILRRFNKKIEFFEPNKTEIISYINILTKKTNIKLDASLQLKIADKLKGNSFATVRDRFLDSLKKFLLDRKEKRPKVIDKGILNYFS